MSTPLHHQNEMFSSRSTLTEAISYSQELISTLPLEHRMAATTALWVSLNTALAQLEKASLSNITRRSNPPATLPSIATISPQDAAQIARDLLIPTLAFTKNLDGKNQEVISIFLLLVTRMFDMDEEEILDDLTCMIVDNLSRRG